MLIDFRVRNWMSFRDNTQLSMEATDIEKFRKKLPRINKFKLSVLPISMIFGGNASGKSNFVKALKFAQKFIVKGTDPDKSIEVSPFLLFKNSSDTNFEFVILIDEKLYGYSFSVNRERVTEERLEIVNSIRKRVLFHRRWNKKDIEIDESLYGKNNENGNFLRKMARGIRANQLFLTNSMQYEKSFKPIYDWFSKKLLIILPESKYGGDFNLFDQKLPHSILLNDAIPRLDLGISSIGGGKKIPFGQIELPDEMKNDIFDTLKKDGGFATVRGHNDRFLFGFEEGEISAKKFVFFHNNSENEEVQFEFSQESDGTRRMIDLLPAIYNSIKLNVVLVIDEIDRSIHPLLITKILESYLKRVTPKFRSQLIFTTHCVELLDEKMFRADEFWIAHKNIDGATELQSLNEFEGFRSIENFRKKYLEGRFRGIPQFHSEGIFDTAEDSVDSMKGL